MKKTYYLSPNTHFYNYAIECTCKLSLAFPKGMYCTAYSLKQAIVYFKRRLAIHEMCDFYDIEFPIGDIQIIDKDTKND